MTAPLCSHCEFGLLGVGHEGPHVLEPRLETDDGTDVQVLP